MAIIDLPAALKQLSLSSWRPFDSEFAPFKASLGRQCREVESEVTLASNQAAVRAQRLEESERSLNTRFRRKVDLHLQDDHKLRLQMIEQKSRKTL